MHLRTHGNNMQIPKKGAKIHSVGHKGRREDQWIDLLQTQCPVWPSLFQTPCPRYSKHCPIHPSPLHLLIPTGSQLTNALKLKNLPISAKSTTSTIRQDLFSILILVFCPLPNVIGPVLPQRPSRSLVSVPRSLFVCAPAAEWMGMGPSVVPFAEITG